MTHEEFNNRIDDVIAKTDFDVVSSVEKIQSFTSSALDRAEGLPSSEADLANYITTMAAMVAVLSREVHRLNDLNELATTLLQAAASGVSGRG